MPIVKMLFQWESASLDKAKTVLEGRSTAAQTAQEHGTNG
jgi:hypothetical protein